MRVLLDTHYLIWSMYDTRKLKAELIDLLEDEINEVEYSIVSLWETEIKHLKYPESFVFTSADTQLDAQRAGYHILNLRANHVFALGSLKGEETGHKDPFDRMLIAQAKSEGMLFVTHDKRLLAYDEPCVKYF